MALTKIHKKCIGTHQLDIGLFYFYENFVIGEVKEGQNIDFECAKGLYELVERYYKNTIPYVYISNRIHSYSFKPTGHYKSSGLFTNLKGYGIITYSPIGNNIAVLEQFFMNRPSAIFHNIEDAVKWAEQIISVN